VLVFLHLAGEPQKDLLLRSCPPLPRVPAGHKCSRMHGHSYRVEVVVRGPVNPQTGWLIDFAVIDERGPSCSASSTTTRSTTFMAWTIPPARTCAASSGRRWARQCPSLGGHVWETRIPAAPTAGGRLGHRVPTALPDPESVGREAPLERRMDVVAAGLRALRPTWLRCKRCARFRAAPNQAEEIARAVGLHHVFAPRRRSAAARKAWRSFHAIPILEHDVLELPTLSRPSGASCCRPAGPRQAASGFTPPISTTVWHTAKSARIRCGPSTRAWPGEAPIAADPDGRLQCRPESDEIRYLRGLATLAAAAPTTRTRGTRLHPGSRLDLGARESYTARLAFLEPDRRLDYIFSRSCVATAGEHSRLSDRLRQAEADGVFASDHFGLLAEIQVEQPDVSYRARQ